MPSPLPGPPLGISRGARARKRRRSARPAFFAVLTSDATMSDDGSERDLKEWTEREIFSSHGHMNVESEAADGQSLIAAYSNSTWGEMRTAWRFELSGDQIARFETGQA
jgi:hypothetical protein